MTISINGTTGISGVDGSASTPALQGNDSNTGISFGTDEVAINTNGTQRALVDSSGNINIDSGTLYVDAVNNRVGVGNSSPGFSLTVGNATATVDTALRAHSAGAVTHRYDIDTIGTLTVGFNNSGSTINNMPTGIAGLWMQQAYPIIFATNGTERARITSGGDLCVGSTGGSFISNTGSLFAPDGASYLTRSGANVVHINRLANDGDLVNFYQAGTGEGSISVSGTTVSYNGAHLSRWSQISGVDPHDKGSRPDILRGTVMTNLDEMCEWIDPKSGDPQANEQLNKTKVSDTDDDPNVAGVFQSWDDDDDTWVNDYYLAMTGDFVIRIASDITVQRGDLLVSAGDGTARPQGDRYIKDSTIAKVTSTTVSHVHPDGSYCVPCVLMAC